MLALIVASTAFLVQLTPVSTPAGAEPPCALVAEGALVRSSVWGLRNRPPWLANERPAGERTTGLGQIVLARRGQPGETRRWSIRRSNLSLGRDGAVTTVIVAEGTVRRTLVEEVEPGLWEEEITWERFAYGQGGPPPQEVTLEEAPAVIGLSYRRQPRKLGVPVADLPGLVPGVAGTMLLTLALDVATWRMPVESLQDELGPRVDPGDWICDRSRAAQIEELDPDATGLEYDLGEFVVAVVGTTVVDGEDAALLWFALEGNRVDITIDLGPNEFVTEGTEYFRGFVALSVEDGRPLAGSLTGPLVSRSRMGPKGGDNADLPVSAVLQEVSFREVR